MGEMFDGKTITLDASINLNGQPFTPIGSGDYPFKGTFDGQGNTIRGYSNGSNGTSGDKIFTAFFSKVDGGTIKNIIFEDYEVCFQGETSGTDRMTSVVVGILYGGSTLSDITVGEGSVDGPVRVGGIVARTQGGTENAPNIIAACSNYADVSTEMTGELSEKNTFNTYATAGGIISTVATDDFVIVSDSHNYGSIEGNCSGGLVGDIMGHIEISNSTNSGRISGALFAGGIAGDFWYSGNGSIIDSHNLASAVIETIATKRTNNGEVYSDACIGGILGAGGLGGKVTISGSTNSGTLKNVDDDIMVNIGGIVGFAGTNPVEIKDSYSHGTIENSAKVAEILDTRGQHVRNSNRNRWTVGGIVGHSYAPITIIDSFGTDTIANNNEDYYAYGNVVGFIKTVESGNDIEISFAQMTDITRPVALLYAGTALPDNTEISSATSSNNGTITLSGIDMDYLDFTLNHGAVDIDLTESAVQNLSQLVNLDCGGSWCDWGAVNITTGDIDKLVIWPDFGTYEGSYYPTYGNWSNIISVEGDSDGFAWECPSYHEFSGGTSVIINSTAINDISGTVSV